MNSYRLGLHYVTQEKVHEHPAKASGTPTYNQPPKQKLSLYLATAEPAEHTHGWSWSTLQPG